MNSPNPQMPPGMMPPGNPQQSAPAQAAQSPYGMPPGMNQGMPVQSVTQPQAADTSAKEESVTIGPFILNYPKLFVPEVYTKPGTVPDPKRKPQYSCELRCLQSSPDFQKVYGELYAAANPVSMSAFKIPVDSPKHRNRAIRSLEEKKGDNPPGFFITPKSVHAPNPVVGNPPRLATPDEIYSGCIVYALLKPYAYENEGEGISWFLNGIWKVGDGERLAPERDPAAAFSHLLNTVQMNLYQSAAPAGMQAPPGYSPQMPPAMPPQGYNQQMPQQGYGPPPGVPFMAPAYPPQQGYAPQYGQPPMPGFNPTAGLPY